MKKLLMVIVAVAGLVVPVMGEQVYTNSSLKKYDSYRRQGVKSRSSSGAHTSSYSPGYNNHTYSSTSSMRSSKNRTVRRKINKLKGEARKLDHEIKEATESEEFHRRLGTKRRHGSATNLSSLKQQRQMIQEQINDLELVGVGADPYHVIDRRKDIRTEQKRAEREIQRQAEARHQQPHSVQGGYDDNPNSVWDNDDESPTHINCSSGWDDKGNHYRPAGNGNAWRSDGALMRKAGGGFYDPNGNFIPCTK